jgi:hypothetical protein
VLLGVHAANRSALIQEIEEFIAILATLLKLCQALKSNFYINVAGSPHP